MEKSELDKILKYNQAFVDSEQYKRYQTDKYPERKIAILTCMDTRLTELLPAALGFKNGDVKLIKNAGALIAHPYGSVMYSFVVAIYELGVDTIFVIGHDDCGIEGLNAKEIIEKMLACGIEEETLQKIKENGVDLEKWLKGFDNVWDSVHHTVDFIKEHPLIHKKVQVLGFVMNPVTGEIRKA